MLHGRLEQQDGYSIFPQVVRQFRQLIQVREVLREWSQFLDVAETGAGEERHKRYRIYHASFQDFVAAKEEVEDERVDLAAANRMISTALWGG